jgi:uncharacterized protein YozE (UPF0346 family)
MQKNYEDSPECYKDLKENEKEALEKWIKVKFEEGIRTYKKRSSYGLKHDFQSETGIYVYNGAFKGAMIKSGFKAVDDTELNWYFKIKERITDSFWDFCIKRYKYNDSILGDFTRDMDKAPEFPKESQVKEDIKDYLYRRNACKEVMKAFEKAWKYYDTAMNKSL